MTVEGLSGIEALSQLGFTAEQFSNFSLVSSLVNQAAGYGVFAQTLSGISALVGAGIKLALDEQSTVNHNLYSLSAAKREEERLVNNGIQKLSWSFGLDPLNWDQSLLHAVGKSVWEGLQKHPGVNHVYSNLEALLRQARWVVKRESTSALPHQIGEVIHFFESHVHSNGVPDWLLPLILGLKGDPTPAWHHLEDGP
ncbi:VP3 [Raccoon polyomavirus]|nr:VP3 [Raccoon polyomavirus]AFP58022.1 VP3 [Raccoon polyomavirus]